MTTPNVGYWLPWCQDITCNFGCLDFSCISCIGNKWYQQKRLDFMLSFLLNFNCFKRYWDKHHSNLASSSWAINKKFYEIYTLTNMVLLTFIAYFCYHKLLPIKKNYSNVARRANILMVFILLCKHTKTVKFYKYITEAL